MEQGTSFRLGDWKLDRDLGRLTHDDGRLLQPEPKTLELLLTLAESPGRPVSRENLKARLWSGDHIAPGALKHLVWQLRRDLGDDASSPRYIETVRGKGYRLLLDLQLVDPRPVDMPADMQQVDLQSADRLTTARPSGEEVDVKLSTGPIQPLSEAPSASEPGTSRNGATRFGETGFGLNKLAVFGLAGLLGVVGIVVVIASRSLVVLEPKPREQPSVSRQGEPGSRPLTALPGNELSPAMAPDGSFVAFVWNGGEDGDDYDLFRIATSGGVPEALVRSPEDEVEPAVSPDGHQLAFLRGDHEFGGKELRVLDLESRQERLVAETPGWFLDVVWMHQGESLIVSELPEAGGPAQLRSISLAGLSTPLTEPEAQTRGDFFPAVSPGGQTVAFYRRHRGGLGQVMLFDRTTKQVKEVDVVVGRIAGLTFDSSGEGLIVSSDRVPPRGLWRLSLTGKEAQWLGLAGSFVSEPSSSLAGAVTYQDQRCDSNVWSLSLDRSLSLEGPAELPAELPAPSPVHGLESTRQDMQAVFSPNGKRVAFLSNRGGANQIWIARWPGGDPRPIPNQGGPVLSLGWSPDGQKLAFTVRETTGVSSVHIMGVEGADQTRISDGRSHSIAPSWSWAGDAIYYSARVEEAWRIMKFSLESREAVDMGPGIAAKEEPGGVALWILDGEEPGLSRRVSGQPTEAVIPFLSAPDAENWQPIAGGVLFLHWSGKGQRHLSRWTVDSGEIERVAALDRNLPYPSGLSVSPDGSTILWTRIDSVASDLLLAEGPF